MADHQHAPDTGPDADTASDAYAAGAAGEEPRAHERAGAPGEKGAPEGREPRAERSAPEQSDGRGKRGTSRGADRGEGAGVTEETVTNGADQEVGVPTGGSSRGDAGSGRPGSAGAGGVGTTAAGAGGSAARPDNPGSGRDGTAAEQREGVSAAEASVPRLRRDPEYKMLAGVCAGLARQCDMDPVIFRITLAVLSATGGIGLIFYGFAWLFVPYAGEEENEVRKLLTGRVDGQALAAVLFALVGCGVFLTMVKNGGVLTFAVVLSVLLAGAGYWSQRRAAPEEEEPSPSSGPRPGRPNPIAAQAAADAPPEAKAPPVPAAYPSWWRDPIVKDGTHVGGTGYLWGPRDAQGRDVTTALDVGLGAYSHGHGRPDVWAAPPVRAPRPRGPRWIGGWLFLLALLACGLTTSLTWQDHPLGSSLQAGLSAALIVLGLGIAVSAFLGRTGAGSVLLAVVTAGLLAGAAALPRDISTHWIEREWRPAAVTDIRESYDLGTGEGTLDLSRVKLAAGQSVSTDAEVGLGRLRVILPPDVTVKLDIEVGLGDIQLPGDDEKDVDVQPDRHTELTLPPVSGGKDTGTLVLDLQVGAGQAEVARAAS